MPLDSTGFHPSDDGAREFARFSKKPTLKGLAYALRHPEVWPTDFGPWNYMKPSTCAIGLTRHLLAEQAPWWAPWRCREGHLLHEVFGISRDAAHNIFFCCYAKFGPSCGWTTLTMIVCNSEDGIARPVQIEIRNITPEHVATAIDMTLAEQEESSCRSIAQTSMS